MSLSKFSVIALVCTFGTTSAQAHDRPAITLDACVELAATASAAQARLGYVARQIAQTGIISGENHLVETEFHLNLAGNRLVYLMDDEQSASFANLLRNETDRPDMSPTRARRWLERRFDGNFWMGTGMLGDPNVINAPEQYLEAIGLWSDSLEETATQTRAFCALLEPA